MSSEKVHFFSRKFENFQRQAARPYACHLCAEEPAFSSQARLFEHAGSSHSALTAAAPGSKEWQEYLAGASSTSKRRAARKPALEQPPVRLKPSSTDSMRLNVDDDSRPRSAPRRQVHALDKPKPAEAKLENFNRLSLSHGHALINPAGGHIGPTRIIANPLKRSAVESRSNGPSAEPGDDQAPARNRRAKATPGGAFVPAKDPDFDRDRKSHTKRLFDPTSDKLSSTFQLRKSVGNSAVPSHQPDTHLTTLRNKQNGPKNRNQNASFSSQPVVVDPSPMVNPSDGEISYPRGSSVQQTEQDVWNDGEPELLLQPETRPISHEQLVAEVKNIYSGLVLVEAKCIDVDEKQTIAARERDPSRRTKLTSEQWQALIALHKTLLHEHHDFFLASQHPSASPALSRLAAKYSMPARMWRHGIHAFLEVLRHRLPESLDHMLTFVYIAYSMMALLYETVPAFESTWVECLGDIGRYRIAMHDDDIRDRETWGGVSRFWYSKAADKSPKTGRLYHHLAILTKAYTVQQLSLFGRSLTCVMPFIPAKSSIMTLFGPVLSGHQDTYSKAPSMEILFVKAHGLYFTGRSAEEFRDCVRQLIEGRIVAKYIVRCGTKFKEVGVSAAIANAAALFEYGSVGANGAPRSILRLAFLEARVQAQASMPNAGNFNMEDQSTNAAQLPPGHVDDLSSSEYKLSESCIAHSSSIAFGTFNVGLECLHDKNVQPMIHVYLVMLWSFARVERAMVQVEREVPWTMLVLFLNAHATPGTMTARVRCESFPKADEGLGRPLPEDFSLRGQLWAEFYFPADWFEQEEIDDEERTIELPSMAAPRLERILWLAYSLAAPSRWISYDHDTNTFSETNYIHKLPSREVNETPQPLFPPSERDDSVMTGTEDMVRTEMQVPSSPPKQATMLETPPRSSEQASAEDVRWPKVMQPTMILKRETLPKGDVGTMDQTIKQKVTPPLTKSINPHSEEYLQGNKGNARPEPVKRVIAVRSNGDHAGTTET